MTKKRKTSRQARLDRLNEIILANPSYGRKKLAKELKREYGVAFRLTTIAAAREAALLGKKIPHKRPTGIKSVESILAEALITPERAIVIGFDEAYHRCRSAGFINDEIRTIFSAGNVPELFSSKPFNAMLRRRRRWVRDKLREGKTRREILAHLKKHCGKKAIIAAKPEISPFEFLRREYQDPVRVSQKAYSEKARKRAEQKTRPVYAKIKGRRIGF